jgi:hypothetical protein
MVSVSGKASLNWPIAMPSSAEALLVHQLERSRVLHQERAASTALAAALDRVAQWQARRLNATYSDLAADPRYADAIAFFQSELYGPGDFSQRDADLARVVPIMIRVLPEAVVETVAMAMELSTLSHELDHALVGKLDASKPFTVSEYCDAYRACDNRAERARQIELIVQTGRALDRYVRQPMLRPLLSIMRHPARAAGLSSLQKFLEGGFASFAGIRDADAFLEAIHTRETALMEAIVAGDRAPFPDPADPAR